MLFVKKISLKLAMSQSIPIGLLDSKLLDAKQFQFSSKKRQQQKKNSSEFCYNDKGVELKL